MRPQSFNISWQCLVEGGEQGYEVVTGENVLNMGEPLHIKAALPEGKLIKVMAETSLTMGEETLAMFNGYQSRTYTPELRKGDTQRGVQHLPKGIVNKLSLDRYGDNYFTRYGDKSGIFHGWSWCQFRENAYFMLLASLDEKPGYTKFSYDAAASRLTIERDCCGIECGGEYPVFDLFCSCGSEEQAYGQWFDALGIEARTKQPIAGYCTWYCRRELLTEELISDDLEGCRQLLSEGDLFEIDDGWESFTGDWLCPDWHKFPSGMKSLCDNIHEAGFRAGLWVAPFVAEESSFLFREHPEMFLKMHGKPWKAGAYGSGIYSLNIDHPAVKKYLRDFFDKAINEWGVDCFRLDFLYAAAPFGTRNETRAARMMRAIDMLRELCGDKLIIGCGVPLFPAFGKLDYCRTCCDVSLSWDDSAIKRLAHPERPSTLRAVADAVSRSPLDGRAFGNDTDAVFFRDNAIELTPEERDVLCNASVSYGSTFIISDDTWNYSQESVDRYRQLRRVFFRRRRNAV